MRTAPTIVYYISGHGWGHLTRSVPVIVALRTHLPRLQLEIRTESPAVGLLASLGAGISVTNVCCDPGLIESSELGVDEAATVRHVNNFYAALERWVQAEVSALGATNVVAIGSDVVPGAFAVANAIGVPSFGVGNFTWDRIYGRLDVGTSLDMSVSVCRRLYAQCDRFFLLPYGQDDSPARTTIQTPLLARVTPRTRHDMRNELGLEQSGILVVFSSRSWSGIPMNVPAEHSDWTFAGFSAADSFDPGRSCLHLGPEWRKRFPEVLAAADVLVSKIGYGVCAEATAAGVSLIFPSRPRFPEHAFLRQSLLQEERHVEVDPADFDSGRLVGAIESVTSVPRTTRPAPGAEFIARSVAATLCAS